jgi:uncharacterized protein YhaN
MRIDRLELRAYGPFTGVVLDLGGKAGLHVIHGRNEAGKSTTLRALRGLLFGMPHQSKDAHTHPVRDLRVGAVLRNGSGASVAVVRRKGRKNDLMDLSSEAPVEPMVLSALLGGVDDKLFDAMYGLDHESLRRGGEALLRGEGEVGASLLDAGIGGQGVQAVLASLEREAAALFLAQGSNPPLNRALSELAEAKKRVRQAELSADAWHTQRAAIDRARAERQRLDEAHRNVAEELYRLERLRAVLGPIEQLRALREERERLGPVAAISEEAMAESARAEEEREAARAELERVGGVLARLEGELAGLETPAALAEVPEEIITDLANRLGALRKARAEAPRVRARLEHLESEARVLLQRVRPGADLAAVESMRLRSGFEAKVRELAAERGGLRQALAQAERALETASADRASAEARLDALVEVGAHADLASLPAPGAAELSQFANAFAELRDDRRDLARRREEVERQVADVERQLDAERRAGEVPTEADLARARNDRDALWARVRGGDSAPDLAEAFEQAMGQADELADRLRREATRVASHARLAADGDAAAREAERLEERAAALTRQQADLQARWEAAWAPSGIAPREPATMIEWRALLDQARDRLTAERAAALQAKQHEGALGAWHEAWAACMGELELAADAAPAEAASVLEDLKELFVRVDAAAEHRRHLATMDAEREALEGLVAPLAASHAPDLVGPPLEDGADGLIKRWHRAQHERTQRARLHAEQQDALAQRESQSRRLGHGVEALEVLVRRAGAGSLEELRALEVRARQAMELGARMREVEHRILELGEGASIAELETQASGHDAAELRARVDALQAEAAELDGRRQRLAHELGASEKGLEVLEQRSAAEAAEQVAEALARVRTHAHRYVRLRLASALLRREMERYRQRHEDPVLRLARDLFPRLTLGAYSGLRVGFGDGDEQALLCVRADGVEVPVTGLSDGTRDQLYLALRVATVAHHAASSEPMPFVLDDVFVHFDDQRARAGLEVLADLGDRTQVLLFTHHARIVELARQAVGPERLCIHDLDHLRGREGLQAGSR